MTEQIKSAIRTFNQLLFLGKVDLPKEEIESNIEIAIECMEKNISKKPIKDKEPRYGMGNEYHDWICPNCGKWLAYQPDYHRYEIHHCKCGQKLDWSDEE